MRSFYIVSNFFFLEMLAMAQNPKRNTNKENQSVTTKNLQIRCIDGRDEKDDEG